MQGAPLSITQIRDAGSGLTAGGDTASRGVVGEVGKGAESEMDVDDDEILQRKGGEGMDDRTRHLDGRNVLEDLVSPGNRLGDDKEDSSRKTSKKRKVRSSGESDGEGEGAKAFGRESRSGVRAGKASGK